VPIGWVLARRGRFGSRSLTSLPAQLFLVSVLSFVRNPVVNAFSHLEHQADQYGLEITAGSRFGTDRGASISEAQRTRFGRLQIDPVDVCLLYDHPSYPRSSLVCAETHGQRADPASSLSNDYPVRTFRVCPRLKNTSKAALCSEGAKPARATRPVPSSPSVPGSQGGNNP